MRKVSVALSTLAAVVLAVAVAPQAVAQKADTSGSAAPPDAAALEKPGPRIEPKSIAKPAPATPKKGRVGKVGAPTGQQTVDERRAAALDEVREVQTQQLSKFSMHRQKVMRIDNLPKARVHPVSVIYGSLGPYGYLNRYRAGQTGANRRNAKNQVQTNQQGGLGGRAGSSAGSSQSNNPNQAAQTLGAAMAGRAGGGGRGGRRYQP